MGVGPIATLPPGAGERAAAPSVASDVIHLVSRCYTSRMTTPAFGAERADELLDALGEQLAAVGHRF
jgi:hypothetical protein